MYPKIFCTIYFGKGILEKMYLLLNIKTQLTAILELLVVTDFGSRSLKSFILVQ